MTVIDCHPAWMRASSAAELREVVLARHVFRMQCAQGVLDGYCCRRFH